MPSTEKAPGGSLHYVKCRLSGIEVWAPPQAAFHSADQADTPLVVLTRRDWRVKLFDGNQHPEFVAAGETSLPTTVPARVSGEAYR